VRSFGTLSSAIWVFLTVRRARSAATMLVSWSGGGVFGHGGNGAVGLDERTRATDKQPD
jgi:hypothetical protein